MCLKVTLRSYLLYFINVFYLWEFPESIVYNLNYSKKCHCYQNRTKLSVQLISVIQLCLTLCDPMDCSTPAFPVLRYLLEFAQTHVRRVDNAIQPSHPLLPPSPPSLSLL